MLAFTPSINGFAPLYDDEGFFDTVIKTQSTSMHVHAAVLAAHSASFHAMLKVRHAVAVPRGQSICDNAAAAAAAPAAAAAAAAADGLDGGVCMTG